MNSSTPPSVTTGVLTTRRLRPKPVFWKLRVTEQTLQTLLPGTPLDVMFYRQGVPCMTHSYLYVLLSRYYGIDLWLTQMSKGFIVQFI